MFNYQRGRLDAALGLPPAALRIDGARADAQSDAGFILFAMSRPADALARYEAAHQVSSMKSSRAASILP